MHVVKWEKIFNFDKPLGVLPTKISQKFGENNKCVITRGRWRGKKENGQAYQEQQTI